MLACLIHHHRLHIRGLESGILGINAPTRHGHSTSPIMSESPQVRLIREYIEASRAKDVDRCARVFHTDYVQLTLPPSAGVPPKSKVEWLAAHWQLKSACYMVKSVVTWAAVAAMMCVGHWHHQPSLLKDWFDESCQAQRLVATSN